MATQCAAGRLRQAFVRLAMMASRLLVGDSATLAVEASIDSWIDGRPWGRFVQWVAGVPCGDPEVLVDLPPPPLLQVLPVGLPNCDLLAATNASHYQLTLPESPVFAGVPLSHQFVQLAISPSGVITSLSSSKALTLVLGLF